jgi:hypothetical protein
MWFVKTSIRYAPFIGVCVALLACGPFAARPQPAASLALSNVTIVAGQPFTLPLAGSDPAGLPLTYSIVSNNLTNLTAALVVTNLPLDNVATNPAAVVINREATLLCLTAPTNVTGTALLTVQGQNSSGFSTQAVIQVNIVATQSMAESYPFTWWGGISNRPDLWEPGSNHWDTGVPPAADSGNGQPRQGRRRLGQ